MRGGLIRECGQKITKKRKPKQNPFNLPSVPLSTHRYLMSPTNCICRCKSRCKSVSKELIVPTLVSMNHTYVVMRNVDSQNAIEEEPGEKIVAATSRLHQMSLYLCQPNVYSDSRTSYKKGNLNCSMLVTNVSHCNHCKQSLYVKYIYVKIKIKKIRKWNNLLPSKVTF